MRRLIYLAVFAAAVWLAVRSRSGDFLGMLSPVAFLVAVFVAIVALIAAVFNLRLGNPRYEDSGFGFHPPLGMALGKLGILVFAAGPLWIAARGIYRGVIPAIGSDGDVAFSHAPWHFCGALVIWLAIGVAMLALHRRVSAAVQAEDNGQDRR